MMYCWLNSTDRARARSGETVKRSALADFADYGYCTSHSRFFWGFRLHALFAPTARPAGSWVDECEVALELLARSPRPGGETLLGDEGYAGREFATAVSQLGATIVRPRRKDEPVRGPHLAPFRQRIESILWTCKNSSGSRCHGARTIQGRRERFQRFPCLAACIVLNHQLGRPSRAPIDYIA